MPSIKSRIPKDDERQLADLKDYVELLRDAVKNVEAGERRYYKVVLMCLRALIADLDTRRNTNKAIVDRFIDRHEIRGLVRIIFPGMEGIPETNPLSKRKELTLDEYLGGKMVLESEELTLREFIWRLSSQDGVHSDDSMETDLAQGEFLYLMGAPANLQQALSIARNILIYCDGLLPQILARVGQSQED